MPQLREEVEECKCLGRLLLACGMRVWCSFGRVFTSSPPQENATLSRAAHFGLILFRGPASMELHNTPISLLQTLTHAASLCCPTEMAANTIAAIPPPLFHPPD